MWNKTASKRSLKQNDQISSGTSHHKAAVRINPTPNSLPPPKATPSWGGRGCSITFLSAQVGNLQGIAGSYSLNPASSRHPTLLILPRELLSLPPVPGPLPLLKAETCKLRFHFLSTPAPIQLTPHCYTCILSFLLWLKIHTMTFTTLTILGVQFSIFTLLWNRSPEICHLTNLKFYSH